VNAVAAVDADDGAGAGFGPAPEPWAKGGTVSSRLADVCCEAEEGEAIAVLA
jgi:hypothetical protein